MSSATGPKMHSDPPAKRSSFALRYYDFADGHSDLTPRPTLIPPFPSFSTTPPSRTPSNQRRDWDTIETNQRNRLHSFTTRELLNLDAITERPMAASTLSDVPILALLRKTQWDRTGTMFGRKEAIIIDDWERSGDEEGVMYGSWNSENGHVWKALRPMLTIANQYLLSSHMLPWFDALLLAPRKPIPPERNLLDVPDLQYFSPRHPAYNIEDTRKARDKILNDVLLEKHDILFSFFEPGKNPYTGEIDVDADENMYPDQNTLAFADIRWNKRDPGDDRENPCYNIVLMLNVDFITPLIVDKYLNHAERYAISWRIAVVIVHELVHAIELARNYPSREIKMMTPPASIEPYFEEEALAELGYSYENAVNGGYIETMLNGTIWKNRPLGYWLVTPWPTMEMILTYTSSIENPQLDGDPQPPNYKYLHPIPVTVYEDVQSISFWEHAVRPYGHKILYYRTMRSSVGIKVEDEYVWGRNDITGRVNVSPLRNESKSFVDDVERLKNSVNCTPEEKKILQIGNKLIKTAGYAAVFWSDSTVQRQSINEYIMMIEDSEMNNLKDKNIRVRMFNILMKATENHVSLMQNQLRIDELNHTISADRRIDLLKFNRGMRALIHRVKLEWQIELSHPVIRLSTILNHLEMALMYILVPDQLTQLIDTEDQKEINVISQARIEFISGNVESCQETISGIHQNPGTSSYAITCAGLLNLACAFASGRRVWDDAQNKLTQRYFARIRYLTRLYDGGKREWIELLGHWIKFAKDLGRSLDYGGMHGIGMVTMSTRKKRNIARDMGEDAPPYTQEDI
ncbi:uncharacterized protein EAE98_011810 [Botrytis deweyae]|uniref:Uncharacterized protein n=1 Tax=Botrytis deweyae TaxID=2478750 RepID=A0ABQ7I4S6_9HELO|nr:uncharacterized protein EAE98_011810 [Botrytis deweyae]KAF7911867.1 hypothetical protein EAE98_011810 [Botrytis deweyae]